MLEGTTFGRTVSMLERNLDVAMIRQDVIANNIANADVPNFKRSVINFESYFKRAVEAENYEPDFKMATTDSRHIASWEKPDWRNVQPRRVLDYLSTSKNNGNNVNPEQEFLEALTNQLRYTLMTQATAFEFNQVNQVLK